MVRTSLYAACMLCAPALAQAQTALPERGIGPEDEIVVTGTGLPPAPGERAYDIVAIDRDRLLQSASGRLEDALRDVAGLQQFRRSDSRSANPTSQGITLRGLGGNAASRALLVLDGVPQADPFGGWVAFPAYATDRLGRVRVTRGAGSGVAGPGALAGTIELESAVPDDLSSFQGVAAIGSRDTIDTRASAAYRRDGGFATLSGAYSRGDGFVPIVEGDRGAVDRPAGFEQASGAARAVFAVASSTELQANVSAFSDRRERGVRFTETASEGADASVRIVGRGPLGWSALAYVQTRAFASRFAAVSVDRSTATLTLDQRNVPATGIGGRLEVAPRFGAVALRIGGDVRDVTGETQELYTYVAGNPTRRRVAGGSNRTAGLFADGSVEAGRWTLSAGGRIDHWSINDGRLVESTLAAGPRLTDARYADRNGWEPTGRVGVAWGTEQGIVLRAAAYRGWRLPTLNELYRPFRVGADATGANAGLAPETFAGGEVGAQWRPLPTVRLAVTGFAGNLHDAIANVTVARGPGTFPGVGFVSAAGSFRRRENLDRIRVRGVEFDGEARFGQMGLRASYAHTDSRVTAADGAGAALVGLRPAQTPTHQASATVDWRRAGAVAAVTARYVAAQFEDDANVRALDDAFTVDAIGTLPLLSGIALEARVENLTDTVVEAGIGADGTTERAAPRTLWVGLRLGL